MAKSNIPFAQTCSYPKRDGNSVRALVDGTPAFRRICQAIDAATHSVWVTVAFMWQDFVMPDGRGSAFDVLQRAVDRGVDVRLIFWRPDQETKAWRRRAFWGSEEHLELLRNGSFGFAIRWDRAQPGFCQHQKTWLIDAGEDAALAFVGGINLNPNSMASPGHGGQNENHDIYVEVSGPSTVDVHHNFVQRWNGASDRNVPEGCWGPDAESDLFFPENVPTATGHATLQVQRTVHAGRYSDRRASPGAAPFPVADGEQSILEQYASAIRAARESIYIETQYLEVRPVIDELRRALERGVEIVVVVPAEPDFPKALRESAKTLALWDYRAKLASYRNFTLAGLASPDSQGIPQLVYVHAKIMLIDDAWATIGSANLHYHSLFGNGELNVAISDRGFARSMRCELFQEQLAEDTSGMDNGAALRMFGAIARENRSRLGRSDPKWQGLAFTLDLASYGRQPQL